MEKIYGSTVASVFTLMILWTAFGSVFALLLGYSRIPYAAARDGYFFKSFARLHPTGGFPHVSLLVLGGVSIVCSFFSLGLVIDALIATRILVQFIGQIAGVVLLRRRAPEMARPFRIWLYPVPLVHRVPRLALHLQHDGGSRYPLRARRARARRGVFSRVVPSPAAMAVCGADA